MAFLDFSYFERLPENFKELKKLDEIKKLEKNLFKNIEKESFAKLLDKYQWTPMVLTSLMLDILYQNKIDFYKWKELNNFLEEFKALEIIKRDINYPELYKGYNAFKSTFDDIYLFQRMIGHNIAIVENIPSAILDDPQWGLILTYNTGQTFNNSSPEGQFNQNKSAQIGDERDDCSIDVNVNYNLSKKIPLQTDGDNVLIGSVEEPMHTLIRAGNNLTYPIDIVKIPLFQKTKAYEALLFLAPFNNLFKSQDTYYSANSNNLDKRFNVIVKRKYTPNSYDQAYLDNLAITQFSNDVNNPPFADKNAYSNTSGAGFGVYDNGRLIEYRPDIVDIINDADFDGDIAKYLINQNYLLSDGSSQNIQAIISSFLGNKKLFQILLEQSGYSQEQLDQYYDGKFAESVEEFADLYTTITFLLIHRLYLAVIVRNINVQLQIPKEIYPLEWQPVEKDNDQLGFTYQNTEDIVDELYGNQGSCPVYNNISAELIFNNTTPEFKFNNCNYGADGPDEIMALYVRNDALIKYENPVNTNSYQFSNPDNIIQFNEPALGRTYRRVPSVWELENIQSSVAFKKVKSQKYTNNNCKECLA